MVIVDYDAFVVDELSLSDECVEEGGKS